MQIDVSQKIAEALKVSLSDSEKESLAQKPTDDLRAYDFYMRGRIAKEREKIVEIDAENSVN